MNKTFFHRVDGTYPIFAAHRGGGGEFGPENTMYSYRKCLEVGVRMLEIDVRLTKDGEMVMMHDHSVERTTDGSGPVDSYLLSEILELDAAFHHPSLKGSGIRVPTLKEFLHEFAPNENVLFMFDFKDEESIRKAVSLIQGEEYGPSLQGRYIMCSAFAHTNSLLRSLCNPEEVPVTTDIRQSIAIILSYGTGLWRYSFDNKKQSIFVFVLRSPTLKFWSRGLVESLHSASMRVLVCGDETLSNSEERLRECIEWGVDIIMTDRPDILSRLLK